MKTKSIALILLTIVTLARGQGLLNNGANITVSTGAYIVIDGLAGNFTVESGEVYLYGKINLTGDLNNKTANADMFNGIDNNHTDLTFSGTQVQQIGGASTENIICQNLTVNSGSNAILGAGKKLTILGDLVNNGTLTIGAGDGEQSTLKVSGSISGAGTFNVETHLSSGRNWYVSSPVSGAKSSVFNATSNPVYWYDEAHGSTAPWAVINDNTTDLVPFRGYIATVPASGNVTFTGGTFNNSNETVTLYRTAGQVKEGFNLVGNPYPAYYDFGSSTKTNIQPSYWYRAKNSGNTAYIFDTYSVANRLGTSLSGKSVTCNIPPMQAFWVRVDAGQSSGTISFDKQYINHRDLSANRRRSPDVSVARIIRLQVTNGINNDETIMVFNPSASDSFDAYDSPKMSNASAAIPEIYTLAGTETVTINGMSKCYEGLELPLGFSQFANKDQAFKISCTEFSGFENTIEAVLIDRNTNAVVPVDAEMNYDFSSAKYNATDRFSIVFRSKDVNTGNEDNYRTSVPLVYSVKGGVRVVVGASSNYHLATLYDGRGRELQSLTISSTVTDIPLSDINKLFVLVLTAHDGNIYTYKIVR